MSEIKLICFDLDDTLISQNSWHKLGNALGVSDEEDRRWYVEYQAGNISYDRWNEIMLEHYLRHSDATRGGVTKALTSVSYVDGARDSVAYLKAQGYKLVLISGSIDIVVNHVAHDLGFDLWKANNTFIFDDNDRFASIRSSGNDTIAKAMHLESFCKMLGIAMTECACIGDGANDIEMFKRTGHGITFRGSPIEKDAWKVIDSLKDIPTVFP